MTDLDPAAAAADGNPQSYDTSLDGARGRPTVAQTLGAQRRRRRLMFWAGFLAILVLGSLWAGLSKDPLGPNFFGLVMA